MSQKYNSALLNALNEVRAGKTKPFTIGYSISKSLLEKRDNHPILNEFATTIEIEREIINAIEFWQTALNSLYAPNRKIKGALQVKYKESNESSNDINISIKKSGSTVPVKIQSSTIFLSSNIPWKSLRHNIGYDIFSYMVYAIGKVLKIPDSINRKSIMSIPHLAVNYAPFFGLRLSSDLKVLNPLVLLDKEVVKNILKLYGSMNYSYAIVYGCTNRNAINFNSNATRSDNSCRYKRMAVRSKNPSNIY